MPLGPSTSLTLRAGPLCFRKNWAVKLSGLALQGGEGESALSFFLDASAHSSSRTQTSEQSESLLVVLSSTLLRFSSVSLTALDEAISNGDLAAAAEIKSGIAVERIDLENDVGGLSAVDDVACLGLGGRDERVFVAGHGGVRRQQRKVIL